jgi:hypothetical protein
MLRVLSQSTCFDMRRHLATKSEIRNYNSHLYYRKTQFLTVVKKYCFPRVHVVWGKKIMSPCSQPQVIFSYVRIDFSDSNVFSGYGVYFIFHIDVDKYPEVGNIIFFLISYHINIMAKKIIYYQVYIIIF